MQLGFIRQKFVCMAVRVDSQCVSVSVFVSALGTETRPWL